MSAASDIILPVGILAGGYLILAKLGIVPSIFGNKNTSDSTAPPGNTTVYNVYPLGNPNNGGGLDYSGLLGPLFQANKTLAGLFANMYNNAAGQPNAQGNTTPTSTNITPAQNTIARAQASAYYSGGTYNPTSGTLMIGGTGYSVAPSKTPAQVSNINAQKSTGFSTITSPNHLINPSNIFNTSPFNL